MTYETIPVDGTKGMTREIRMKNHHRRGEGNIKKYIRDYDEIFKDQSEDLRENTMMNWEIMKQAWLELVDDEFFRETKEKFVEMRTYEGAMQRDIFELMDKTMLDHRLCKANPKETYHRYL